MKNCTVLPSMISMVQAFELLLMQKNYTMVFRLKSRTHITNQASTKAFYIFGLPLLCATESIQCINTCEIKLNIVWKISDTQAIQVADVLAYGEWFKRYFSSDTVFVIQNIFSDNFCSLFMHHRNYIS